MKKDIQKNEVESNFYKIYNSIITLIFIVMAFFKYTAIYEAVRFGDFAPVFAGVTLGILACIYFIIKHFSTKAANIIAIIFYTLSSGLLFIDSTYFSYMNKFTSIANLKLIAFLGAVKESIKEVNPLKYLWMLYDIPIILIYAIFIHKKLYVFLSKKIKKDMNIKIFKAIKGIAGVLVAISFVVYSNKIGFHLKYVKSENIIYHVRDFINVAFDFEKEIDYEEYFKSNPVEKDENYGIANGKNVIVIQVEALQNFLINREYNGQEITPFLNSLIKDESFYFNNYYYQVGAGNTSDAEFTINNSLLSTTTDAAYLKYTNNTYHGLPHILKENGYTQANAYHSYERTYWNRATAYVNQGFDNFYAMDNFSKDEIIALGLSDEKFLQEIATQIQTLQEPFYSFIITLSSHHPFEIGEEYCNIELAEEHKDTLFGNYLNAANYVDRALEKFFEELKKSELYENSVFVIYGDHFAIPNYNVENVKYVTEFIGHQYSFKDMFNVPLIIHVPGEEKTETIDTLGAHVDFLPTLLHLLGIENNKSIMMGKDLFTAEDNVVYEMMHVGIGSYITNDVVYNASYSGIDVFNEAYDAKTGKRIPITNEMIKQSEEATEYIENAKALLNANKIMIEN